MKYIWIFIWLNAFILGKSQSVATSFILVIDNEVVTSNIELSLLKNETIIKKTIYNVGKNLEFIDETIFNTDLILKFKYFSSDVFGTEDYIIDFNSNIFRETDFVILYIYNDRKLNKYSYKIKTSNFIMYSR